VRVRPEDFHIARRAQRRETTTVFIVDASGSAALHRLAEAKGAVELLLADCYVRRDRVALLAFRGSAAELVLPPTRSLVRAKRALAGLPGGGGTPLALALDAAGTLAGAIVRRGGTPLLVLLTDARANIDRQGRPGREQAVADALAGARRLRLLDLAALLVDTSPGPARQRSVDTPQAATAARQVADALNALYLPLPQMDAARLSAAVKGLAR
jgi:magnesium chelatase subunit D